MKKIFTLIAMLVCMVSSMYAAGEIFTISFNGSNEQSQEGYFSWNTAKHNFNSKFVGTYNGVEYTKGLKMEGATHIAWKSEATSTVTIVQSTWSAKTNKLDGTELAVEDAVEDASNGVRVYTITNVPAGEHKITRGSGENGLFFIQVEYTGVAMTTPYKEANISTVFTFNKYWIDEATGNKYYNPNDFLDNETPDSEATSFVSFKPTSSMIFYPEYSETPRQYTVKFKDWNGNEIIQEHPDGSTSTSWMVDYGTIYNGPIKNYYYRDSSDLASVLRWAFKGWSKYIYGDNEVQNPEYFDILNTPITGDLVLHGHFIKEDCTKVASPLEYFTVNGTIISLNPEYSNLAGKITIPSKSSTGEYFTTIGDFSDLIYTTTHIYFLPDNKFTILSNNCFMSSGSSNNYTLEAINLPNGITRIGDYAFNGLRSLKTINLPDNITYIGSNAFSSVSGSMQIEINELPTKLTTLGQSAFMNGGDGIKITKLPSGLRYLLSHTFSNCPNVKITAFGSNDNSSILESIEQSCF